MRGGATLVQVREKEADGGAFLREARTALLIVYRKYKHPPFALFDSQFSMLANCR